MGIIKSIDSYFQLGKRSESHRMCALQYTQINKKIQIELSLCREQRQTAKDMLSIIKTDIKNLQDISPVIDQEIIKEYNLKYGKYKNVKKPNFVNGLTVVKVNSNSLEQEMAAAASLSHSVRSGGASRAMSVMGDDHPHNQDNINYFNNNVPVDFPVNIFNSFPNSNVNQNPNSKQQSPIITYTQPPNKQIGQIGASAQLIYTPLSQNVNQGQSSKAQTPISSSPIKPFKLQDPNNSNTNVIMSSASSSSPSSNLSTPQLLSSFHNGSQNSIINNNNANEISFVINIPDEFDENDNNDNNPSPSPSPTNSQIGNM